MGFPAEQQGWQNTLLLPRELSVQPISNVVKNDLVQETGSWRVAGDSGNCVELETLGIDIARETYDAMTAAPSFSEPDRTLTSASVIPFNRSSETKFFVLNVQISFPARDSGLQAGFQLFSSELESTTIYYQFSNESIVIDRYNTSAAAETTSGIDTSPESGRLRLFDINDSCGSSGTGGATTATTDTMELIPMMARVTILTGISKRALARLTLSPTELTLNALRLWTLLLWSTTLSWRCMPTRALRCRLGLGMLPFSYYSSLLSKKANSIIAPAMPTRLRSASSSTARARPFSVTFALQTACMMLTPTDAAEQFSFMSGGELVSYY